jgi:hypothetical protein
VQVSEDDFRQFTTDEVSVSIVTVSVFSTFPETSSFDLIVF